MDGIEAEQRGEARTKYWLAGVEILVLGMAGHEDPVADFITVFDIGIAESIRITCRAAALPDATPVSSHMLTNQTLCSDFGTCYFTLFCLLQLLLRLEFYI